MQVLELLSLFIGIGICNADDYFHEIGFTWGLFGYPNYFLDRFFELDVENRFLGIPGVD